MTVTGLQHPPELHCLFQTYELLETILFHLDHASLRNARLVNKFWQTVISKNPKLCTTWRQRLRVRSLRLLILGQGGAGTRTLIERWCYVSGSAHKSFDPHFQNAHMRLPETDGEIWLAHVNVVDGEGGIASLRARRTSFYGCTTDAFVVVYDSGSRHSFEEIKRWWREGKLEMRNEDFQDPDPASSQMLTEERRVAARRNEQCGRPFIDGRICYRLGGHEAANARKSAPAGAPQGRRNPVLLALISTNCDTSSGSNRVETSEGQTFAHVLGVPFYEVSTKAVEIELDAGLPLRGLWKVYREKRMQERAERQRREREGMDVLEKVRGMDTVDGKESKWWQRLLWWTLWWRTRASERYEAFLSLVY